MNGNEQWQPSGDKVKHAGSTVHYTENENYEENAKNPKNSASVLYLQENIEKRLCFNYVIISLIKVHVKLLYSLRIKKKILHNFAQL